MAAVRPQTSLISGAIRHKAGVLHYSLHMAQSLRSTYETVILPRLLHHDVLQHGPDNSYQFLLASRHEDLARMKPSVVIVCMDKDARRTILKSFGRQWRQLFSTYDIKLRVIVDAGFGAIASAQRPLDADALKVVRNVANDSFCGSRIYAATPSDAPVPIATIGGIIQVDGRRYGLSVGHAFTNVVRPAPELDVAHVDESVSSQYAHLIEPGQRESGSTFEDVLIYEMNDSEFTEQHWHEAMADSDAETSISSTVDAAAVAYAVGSDITKLGRPARPGLDMSTTSNTDWALLALTADMQGLNTFVAPGATSPIAIDGVFAEDGQISSDLVHVVGGRSGTQAGTLNITPSSVTLRHERYDVWQIRLTRPMSSGDSGSWVIQDGKLYGIIIAASSNLPWAYMLRANKVFDSIKTLTGAQAVGLPTTSQQSTTTPISKPAEPAPSDSLANDVRCELSSLGLPDNMHSSAPPTVHDSITEPTRYEMDGDKSCRDSQSSESKTSRPSSSELSIADSKHTSSSYRELSARRPAPISLIFPNGYVEHVSCARKLNFTLGSTTTGLSVIIKGHIDENLLSTVGTEYSVDPELFFMHLNFELRNIPPSLPSTPSTILEIPLMTVGFRQLQLMPPDSIRPLHDMQSQSQQAMSAYKFRNGVSSFRMSESYVRNFIVLSESEFAVEQQCSCWLPAAGKSQARVVVWSDVGKGLHQSPGGPWLDSGTWSLAAATRFSTGSRLGTSSALPKYAYPRQSHAKDEPSPPDSDTDHMYATMYSRLTESLAEWSEHGSEMEALGPILQFSAASELMFLAAMEAQLSAIRTHDRPEKVAMYYYENLGRHRAMIDKALHFFRQERFLPKSLVVTRDFEFLLSRIKALQRECVVQKDFVMATWTRDLADQSRRSLVEASSIRYISFLTVLFLPATFITSLFGTNIFDLDTRDTGHGAARLAGLLSLAISLAWVTIVLLLWAVPKMPFWLRRAKMLLRRGL